MNRQPKTQEVVEPREAATAAPESCCEHVEERTVVATQRIHGRLRLQAAGS
jgi:hypothetical protein